MQNYTDMILALLLVPCILFTLYKISRVLRTKHRKRVVLNRYLRGVEESLELKLNLERSRTSEKVYYLRRDINSNEATIIRLSGELAEVQEVLAEHIRLGGLHKRCEE